MTAKIVDPATPSGLSADFVLQHHVPALKSLMATGHVELTARFLPVAEKYLGCSADAQIISFLADADRWLSQAVEYERLNGRKSLRKVLAATHVDGDGGRLAGDWSPTVPSAA
ncbi:MAG: hypothetical protein CL626_04790 [Aurantimonas sp.]|nr:hypothetical protein [Aurantimonas sp.]